LKVAANLGLFGCVGFFYIPATVWLFRTLPEHAGLVALLAFCGPLTLGAWLVVRSSRRLNAAFAPLALRGRMYLLGRQYHGEFAGRQVDVYYDKGPTLSVYLATPLKSRLGIAQKNPGLRLTAGLRIRGMRTIEDASLGHLNLRALDEDWARRVLADPTARDAILRLLREEGPIETPVIQLQPAAFSLQLVRPKLARVTPSRARQWLEDLLTLAQAAEKLPPPLQTAEASWFESTWRSNRGWFPRATFGGSLAITGCILLLGLLLLVVLVILGVLLTTKVEFHLGT
jgi:hypothetical protein